MAVRSKDGKFPMVLDLPQQGVKENFRKGQDIEDFFKEEVSLWETLSSQVRRLNLAGMQMSAVAGHQVAQKALEASEEARKRISSEGSYFAALRDFDGERTVLLRGALGKMILDRGDETETQTAGVIWAAATMLGTSRLWHSNNQNTNTQDLSALSFGQLKLSSWTSRQRGERTNIQRIVEELNDHLADAKGNNEATAELLGKATNELSAAISEHKAGTAELTTANEEAIKTLIETSKKQVAASVYETKENLTGTLRTSTEEIEEFKRKVRIDVGLEEPTNFWTDKADGHRKVALIFGGLFLLAVVGMVVWIDISAVELVADAVERIVGDRTAAALSLVPIAFISVPALAFAWVLRHLSRIIIQNLSLEADARLRGTITKTFKALAADRAMNDAELAIALQALFRPIDGKDHSEIAPPSLGDLLRLGGDGKGH